MPPREQELDPPPPTSSRRPSRPGASETAANAFPASLPWTADPDPFARSPLQSFASDATTLDAKDDRLVSPPLALTAASRLVFWHRFDFGDLPGVDPLLGPLADNGGPTHTHALLVGSPAIDTTALGVAPPEDQRGVPRPQGPRADIGAFELGQ
ncbi:MAG TPA: choice-of-anchor Q domain-containing protein [Thermoanaerobaculia bacterium]|nr:choice-of-anchor Q domain-containing protein [Thermoanaerobaculia bacterium]